MAPFRVQLLAFAVFSAPAIFLVLKAWPAFARTAIAYGLAARVPVAIVMLFAILGRWGTHYDVSPPETLEFDAMASILKWSWIGLLPQLTVWIATTVCGGADPRRPRRRAGPPAPGVAFVQAVVPVAV